MEIFRPVWAEIDLAALTRNLRRIQACTKSEVMPVVKADAYGHGVIPVVAALQKCGIKRFGVALLEEALEIKKVFSDLKIMIIGTTPPEYAELVVREDILAGVFSYEQAAALSRAALSQGKTAVIHIKIDTGMNRIGFKDLELPEILRISKLPNLFIEGIYTHLAAADQPDLSFAKEQLRLFQKIYDDLKAAGLHIPLRHAANSAAILHLPEAHLEIVRPGITLYGLSPSSQTEGIIGQTSDRDRTKRLIAFSPSFQAEGISGLEPVLSWKARVSLVKTIAAGETVSYGRTFQAAYPTKVATIPLGYADGLRRGLSNRGEVIIRGKRAVIIGRVCMDQTMLEVSRIEGVAAGDVVTLLGRDGAEEINAAEMATWLDTISYEIICGISKRVHRKYIGCSAENSPELRLRKVPESK
jgi:alanine racemase